MRLLLRRTLVLHSFIEQSEDKSEGMFCAFEYNSAGVKENAGIFWQLLHLFF